MKQGKLKDAKLVDLQDYYLNKVLLPFIKPKKEDYEFKEQYNAEKMKIEEAKKYYKKLILKYLTTKLRDNGIPAVIGLPKIANIEKLLDQILFDQMEDAERREKFKTLSTVLKTANLPDTEVVGLIEILIQSSKNEKFVELEEKISKFRDKSAKDTDKGKAENILLWKVMPNRKQIQESDKKWFDPNDEDYQKFLKGLKSADQVKEAMIHSKRRQAREERKDAEPNHLRTLLQKALSGDKANLDIELSQYIEKGILTETEKEEIMALISAFTIPQVKLRIRDPIAELKQKLAEATDAVQLISTLKSKPTSSESFNALIEQTVLEKEDNWLSPLRQLQKSVRQCQEQVVLQAAKHEEKSSCLSQTQSKLAEKRREIKISEQERKKKESQHQSALKKLELAKQKPIAEEKKLAEMLAYQMMFAAKIYLDKQSLFHKKWDLRYRFHHRKGDIVDAENMAKALHGLLKEKIYTFNEVLKLILPYLNKSKLHNNSLGTYMLQVLFNKGVPPGLFELIASGNGCPSFTDVFIEAKQQTLSPNLEEIQLVSPKEEKFSGEVQAQIFMKNSPLRKDSAYFRQEARSHAEKNLLELRDLFHNQLRPGAQFQAQYGPTTSRMG